MTAMVPASTTIETSSTIVRIALALRQVLDLDHAARTVA